MNNLESLRQGEGIIDVINMYANIALYYGLIGLFFFLAPYFIALWTIFRLSRRHARSDPDLSLLAAVLAACLFGLLLAMGMGGYGVAVQTFAIVTIGFTVACTRLTEQVESSRLQSRRASPHMGSSSRAEHRR